MTPSAALSAAFAAGDTGTIISETLAMEGAKTVLDIGCGGGPLTRSLARKGFAVTGIDPGEATIARARDTAPDARFEVAGAQDLPFETNAFGGAVFLNSLHHVPVSQMANALREAARVTKPGGPVLVIEPLAEGPFFEVTRIIDDETELRDAAGKAVADAVRSGVLELRGNVVYERREKVPDVETLIARSVAVDPLRKSIVETNRDEIETRFDAESVEVDGKRTLLEPLRIYLMRVPG